MTTSASTPRLRITLGFYLGLWLVTAFVGPRPGAALAAPLMQALAWLVVGAATLGRIWCSVFVAGRKDAVLVTAGPYALCRHPLYTLSIVAAAGLGIGSGSIALTLLAVVVVASLVGRAARAEERFLLSLHGTRYADYMATTPRFRPRLAAIEAAQPPEKLEIQPRVLWKSFLDAGSILLLLALIVLSRTLRDAGITPLLLPLP
jgi:protein-S-isoprenylcysteine O-methyltransferase Ste14